MRFFNSNTNETLRRYIFIYRSISNIVTTVSTRIGEILKFLLA